MQIPFTMYLITFALGVLSGVTTTFLCMHRSRNKDKQG